ncbi:glycine--tRNA ligase [Candidatus Woesearchaeota archaeon]|nr:glycine--tRNA ligase [Candidatus Woesearchaeota archaeon]
MADKISIQEMATFCKKKGLVYPNSDIYGGIAGFWDFGSLGTELKNNIKNNWWNYHVQSREDIVGVDGSIITNPKVWEASGHVGSFVDIAVVCRKCGNKTKLDKHEVGKVKCEKCGGEFENKGEFNPMFTTQVGVIKGDSVKTYLRPETAQLMFTDFKLVMENSRLKLPFGIAQIGKSFRNEISPRDFLFRCREFEQMEIEYFIHPKAVNSCPYLKEVLDYELLVYSSDMQKKKSKPKLMKVKAALDKKIIKTKWHAYWLAAEHRWFVELGADSAKLRVRQHLQEEKSHYALDTWDLEYEFPFGWKELQGIANRTDFDLKQHMKFSGQDLSVYDEERKEKVVPYVVAEPSLGVERTFLVFMFDAYNNDKKRGNVVLKLHPKLAPVKVGIFPLVKNKPDIVKKAKDIYDDLKGEFVCQYDESASVGRRYARADEIGIYAAITIDFESLKDDSVTLRSRDSTHQIRIKINDLKGILKRFLNGERLEALGKIIK